jgi:hypothetical protein
MHGAILQTTTVVVPSFARRRPDGKVQTNLGNTASFILLDFEKTAHVLGGAGGENRQARAGRKSLHCLPVRKVG